MDAKYLIELSKEFFEKAYRLQMDGKYENAIELYKKSLDYYPTAEGYTFMGWALSALGNYEGAIEECKNAIEIDADYGNPYNDIGAYLISLGRYEEALAWLELALKAPKYANREFAHYNLGVVYEKLGLWFEALAEYKKAFKVSPRYGNARKNYFRLQSQLN
ncbi:MAG: tetratricopeptide repeat protein [Ignavibacteriota bacterium]